jgi:hypothetical protein
MAENERAPATDEARPLGKVDFVYDAFHTGAIAGSIVAVFFLAVDIGNGRPLHTPSLMGSVLFGGVAAASVAEVRLDMVAYYTIFHFASFGLLGAAISLAVRAAELHARHPLLLLIAIFVVFEVGFALLAGIFMTGVITELGVARVGAANLLAAIGVGAFLFAVHRPAEWSRVKRALHLA